MTKGAELNVRKKGKGVRKKNRKDRRIKGSGDRKTERRMEIG